MLKNWNMIEKAHQILIHKFCNKYKDVIQNQTDVMLLKEMRFGSKV